VSCGQAGSRPADATTGSDSAPHVSDWVVRKAFRVRATRTAAGEQFRLALHHRLERNGMFWRTITSTRTIRFVRRSGMAELGAACLRASAVQLPPVAATPASIVRATSGTYPLASFGPVAVRKKSEMQVDRR